MPWITPESAVFALVPADICDRQEDVSGECDSVWQEHDDVNLARWYLIAIVVVHIHHGQPQSRLKNGEIHTRAAV